MKWIYCFAMFFLTSSVSANYEKNFQWFLDQLLNSSSLSGYWHIEVFPDRIPVVVSLPESIEKDHLKITKFDQSVIFTHELGEYKNVLVIQSIMRKNEEVAIEFTYPPEGIKGIAKFVKNNEIWGLVDVEIYEN